MVSASLKALSASARRPVSRERTPRLTDTDLEEICRCRRDRNRLGLRQWIVVFRTVCAGDQAGVAAHAWIIPVVGALISFLGVPAGLIGNELSIRGIDGKPLPLVESDPGAPRHWVRRVE